MRFLIQKNRALHSALQIRQSPGKDIEINPHPVGTNFEFPVIALSRRVWLQECLGHIALPEMIAASSRAGIGKHEKLPVAAFKSQIQSFFRPQDPDSGFAPRIRILPLPIGLESHGTRTLPLLCWAGSVESNLMVHKVCLNL